MIPSLAAPPRPQGPAPALRAHVMRPANLENTASDRGVLDLPVPAGPEGIAGIREVEVEGTTPTQEVLVYGLNAGGFVQPLKTALNSNVAGYTRPTNRRRSPVVRLRLHEG